MVVLSNLIRPSPFRVPMGAVHWPWRCLFRRSLRNAQDRIIFNLHTHPSVSRSTECNKCDHPTAGPRLLRNLRHWISTLETFVSGISQATEPASPGAHQNFWTNGKQIPSGSKRRKTRSRHSRIHRRGSPEEVAALRGTERDRTPFSLRFHLIPQQQATLGPGH